MANKKKNNKSKINIYWFYASIVFFILSIGLLGGDSGIQTHNKLIFHLLKIT